MKAILNKGAKKMELAVHGKQMDVGDALRTHVDEKLSVINAKFFNRAIDTSVIFFT